MTVTPVVSFTGFLIFPVKDKICGVNGRQDCAPQTAPITSVFDHEMRRAYEIDQERKGGKCWPLPPDKVPATYGEVQAFTGESASSEPTAGAYGPCERLKSY